MPELVITYNSQLTLKALRDFAKYFDFSISLPKSKKKQTLSINGVSIIPANSAVNTSSMNEIFSGKNISAKKLRDEGWQRKK